MQLTTPKPHHNHLKIQLLQKLYIYIYIFIYKIKKREETNKQLSTNRFTIFLSKIPHLKSQKTQIKKT